jgi:hypothetical protein
MAILTREQILSAADIQSETIPVPEWGGEVIVKALTGKERDQFEASVVDTSGKRTRFKPENIRAKLVALSVVGEDGKRVFSTSDVERLGDKCAAALERVFKVASQLSGITEADIEELEKNSSSSQSAEPGTA